MKTSSSLGLLAGTMLGLLTVSSASAVTLLNTSGSFPTSGTATQTGRLVRNGVSQDFSASEPYPGTNNPTVTFNYLVFTLDAATLNGLSNVQIEVDTQGLGLFASAYVNSYNPISAANPNGSFQTNWLGDQGSSGDYSFSNTPNGTPDISFFGVKVPAGSNLLIVLATAGAGGTGTGTAYSLQVEGFGTVDYSAAVPEPSTLAAVGGGLLGLGWVMRRRSSKESVG